MENLNWIDLNEKYKQLKVKERAGTCSKIDALDLVVIAVELGKRGYVLSEDETTWIKPVKT